MQTLPYNNHHMSPCPPSTPTPPPLALLPHVCHLVYQAGRVVLDVYNAPFDVQHKADDSPVTQADTLAEAVLLQGLRALTPQVPVVAEEATAAGAPVHIQDLFWLVDPLDGTKEFIHRNGEFTVNVALVAHGQPVLGVVYAPALQRLYAGVVGDAAWVEDDHARTPIHCRAVPPEGLTVVASRSHGDEQALAQLLQGQHVARQVQAGSSLKLCRVAEGQADLYPRLGRTMEWDIAAGHAVLAAAGGRVRTLDGEPLTYGKPGLENPHFLAEGLRA
jgi:3'(2'), 5'-bisphosphate nucleotidase